jgi:hypothetical protein
MLEDTSGLQLREAYYKLQALERMWFWLGDAMRHLESNIKAIFI